MTGEQDKKTDTVIIFRVIRLSTGGSIFFLLFFLKCGNECQRLSVKGRRTKCPTIKRLEKSQCTGISKVQSKMYGNFKSPVQREEPKERRPLVYICSPFSGDVEANTENARRYSRFAVDSSAIPICFPVFAAVLSNPAPSSEFFLPVSRTLSASPA